MKILVIAGYCLQVNSSANLCHISYISGLLDGGHVVDLLTVSNKGYRIDESISIPNVRNLVAFDASLYDRFGAKKRQTRNAGAASSIEHSDLRRSRWKTKMKAAVRAMYGIYGTDAAWYWRAKRFQSKERYDCVISLAYPPISHKLAGYLLLHHHIQADKWIQIWEDPWYADIFGLFHNENVRKEEARLLTQPDAVYYVSPLTLMYQKQAFPASKEKMHWKPLPSYYKREQNEISFDALNFGYFGDYTTYVRNLEPFYQVSIELGINVNICGYSENPFVSTDFIHVYPRMPLSELKKYEDEANVLVFLCNLKGGQIPGKIYQYSATNKIILFILDGTENEMQELEDYFKQFNRYIFCKNNIDSIKKGIEFIRSKKYDESYYKPLECFKPKYIAQSILEGK